MYLLFWWQSSTLKPSEVTLCWFAYLALWDKHYCQVTRPVSSDHLWVCCDCECSAVILHYCLLMFRDIGVCMLCMNHPADVSWHHSWILVCFLVTLNRTSWYCPPSEAFVLTVFVWKHKLNKLFLKYHCVIADSCFIKTFHDTIYKNTVHKDPVQNYVLSKRTDVKLLWLALRMKTNWT